MPKNKNKDLGGRPLKHVKYAKERKEVLDRLFQILGVNGDSKTFYFKDIECFTISVNSQNLK